ncbi:hypothetical protein FRC12_024956 [Ceratobasidium sp. 428]|nr:hypothetical protein FRC12_024956 [Ceratobasidium sp. 428]
MQMGCIPSKPPREPTSSSNKVAPSQAQAPPAAAETPTKQTHHIPEVTVHEATPQQSRTSVEHTKPVEKKQKKDGGPEAGAVAVGGGIGAGPAAGAVATGGGDAGGGGGGGGGDGGAGE